MQLRTIRKLVGILLGITIGAPLLYQISMQLELSLLTNGAVIAGLCSIAYVFLNKQYLRRYILRGLP